MKNLLILPSFILLSTFAYSQLDSTSVVQISTTERLVDKYGGKLIQSFNEMIAKIAPMAEEGFKIVVKLQIAKGIAELLPIFFLIVFLSLTFKEYNRIEAILASDKVPQHMNRNNGPLSEDNVTLKIILLLILTILSVILSIIFTYSGITHIIAPEWYAIKEIIELFK